MRVATASVTDSIHVNFIPIQTIMEKLNVRRNYVYNRIIPEVGHIRKGRHTYIDEDSLRLWLKTNANFSRQTVLLANVNSGNYEKKLPAELRYGALGDVRNYSRKRSILPFRSVKPFDFWEKELIHPALVVPDLYQTEELLYRQMFLKGAIKITLGRNKTMFYLEENISPSSFLLPAVDEVKPQKQDAFAPKGRPVERPVRVAVNDCKSESEANEIIRFFRKHQISILQFFYDRNADCLHIEFNLATEDANDGSKKAAPINSKLFAGKISNDDIPF